MIRNILIINLLLMSISWTAFLTEESNPIKICGTPEILQSDIINQMEKLKTDNPAEYQKFIEKNSEMIRFNRQSQQQRMFWAYNFANQQHYTVTATLRRSGTMSNIWVDDASWASNYVTNSILDALLNNLENFSGSSSLDPTKGIVEIDTLLFGQPPNIDGDGIVDFLILDIQDGFDPNVSGSSFIAGYFSPSDQQNLPNSNQLDLMYLDSYPGIFFNNTYRTDLVLSTTAHEFQHLIHYNYDQNEELWVNEGLSELAGTYCGYGLDFPALYLEDPNQSLIQWGGDVRDYARANLWTLYCAEQLGLTFIKNLTQNPNNGINSFNESMSQSGLPGNLTTVYPGWILANFINDTSVDPKHGYYLPEARGLQARITQLVYSYPQTVTGTVKSFGVEYHRFRGSDSLTFSFSSALPQNYWLTTGGSEYQLGNLTELTYNEPGFSEDSSYYLILYSTASALSYRYDAFAKLSLNYYELAFDDNQTDLKISFTQSDLPLIAANRFTVPDNNLTLESISFWNGTSNHTVNIQVYEAGTSGLPGNQLMTPVNLTLGTSDNWVDVVLPQPVTNLNINSLFFVGIQLNQPGASLGYDNQNLPGNSYVRPNNSSWRPLSSFTINQQPANGVWMIRAVLTGLTTSDTTLITPSDEKILVDNSYPNPFSPLANQLNIQYQKGANPGIIQMKVYNSLGQKVGEINQEAIGVLLWSGRGPSGPLAAGVYYYQLIFYDAVTGQKRQSDYQKVIILN